MPVVRRVRILINSLEKFLLTRASYSSQNQALRVCETKTKPSETSRIDESNAQPDQNTKRCLNAPSFQDLKDRVERQEEEIRFLREVIKSYDETLYRLNRSVKIAEENISYCTGSFYCIANEKVRMQRESLKNARKMANEFQEEMKNKLFHINMRIRTTETTKVEILLLVITLIILFFGEKLKR